MTSWQTRDDVTTLVEDDEDLMEEVKADEEGNVNVEITSVMTLMVGGGGSSDGTNIMVAKILGRHLEKMKGFNG